MSLRLPSRLRYHWLFKSSSMFLTQSIELHFPQREYRERQSRGGVLQQVSSQDSDPAEFWCGCLTTTPGLSTFADTQGKGRRLPVHIQTGLQRLNGEICESKNWHDLARFSRGLRRTTMPKYMWVEFAQTTARNGVYGRSVEWWSGFTKHW